MVGEVWISLTNLVLVFATDSLHSFSEIDDWKSKVMKSGTNEDTVLVLVANKCDVQRMTENDMEQLATFGGYDLCFQTSAKTGENFNRMFEETIDLVIERFGGNLQKRDIDLNREKQPKSGSLKCTF